MFGDPKKQKATIEMVDDIHRRLNDIGTSRDDDYKLTENNLQRLDARLTVLADKFNRFEELENERWKKELFNSERRRNQEIRLECLKVAKDVAISGNMAGNIDIIDFTNNLIAFVKGEIGAEENGVLEPLQS